MRCSEVEKLLSSHIDGELDAMRSCELREHIEGCAECATLQHQLVDTAALLAYWPDVEPGRGFDALQWRLQNSGSDRGHRFEWMIPTPKWASAALAVASVMVGVFLGFATTGVAPEQPPTEEQVVSALGLQPHDDILEASISYAAEDSISEASEGEVQ